MRGTPLNADELADDEALLATRHPSVASTARYLLGVNPNLDATGLRIAREYRMLTRWTLDTVDDSAELTAGLRKLLEAKDCVCRAALPAPGARPVGRPIRDNPQA